MQKLEAHRSKNDTGKMVCVQSIRIVEFSHVASVESKVKIVLKRKSLEGAMKDRPSATVDEFLHAISAFSDNPGVDPVDSKEEGTIVEDDDDEAAKEVDREERLRATRFNARTANKEMHPDMIENVWVLGKKKQNESNVLVVRLATEENTKKEDRIAPGNC